MRRIRTLLQVIAATTLAVAARDALGTVPTCGRAQRELEMLNAAIELRRELRGSLPEESEWFEVLIRERLLDPARSKSDPWGQPYVYRKTGNTFDLFSIGPDGRPGTADDQIKADGWTWRTCSAGCGARSGCALR